MPSRPTSADEESSGWAPVDDAAPMIDVMDLRSIADADHITHPFRGRMLRRLRSPHSAAELAEWLEVPVTRLYHHLKLLEQAALIRVVATRRSGSATERRYQSSANHVRVPKEVIERADENEIGLFLGSMVDLAKLELLDFVDRGGLAMPDIDDDVAISFAHLTLSDDQRRTLIRELTELYDRFGAEEHGPDEPTTTFFFAAFPSADAPT